MKMNNIDLNVNGQEMIRVLEYPENIRQKYGMYIDSPSTMLREAIDNATDEVLSCKTCDTIIIDTDMNGYNMVADKGRGIPIYMSPDKPGRTQADVAVSTIHAGSKFVNTDSKIGSYGVGVSATNALSTNFWVLSKITPENYSQSLPVVQSFYESLGPRSKRDVFYYAYYQKGYKISEGAAKKSDLEKMMFQKGSPKTLPTDMSTIILYTVDPEIFPNPKTEIPVDNIQNFLFIQEKFYRRKVTVVANGVVLTGAGIKPYAYEIIRTITPADTSKNPYLGVYVTFEADKSLSPKTCTGSINGLVVNSGVHIQYLEKCFEDALREEYKIKHKTIFPGLKMFVIILAEDLVYDSQIKSRVRSISKVKQSDFQEITKEFIKIFRRNDDTWRPHVENLNALAESYRSIGAVEKAQKIIDGARGNNSFKMKSQNYVEGFSDATSNDRWNCELFLCFTGDTEILTCNNERIQFKDLVPRVESGEAIYTFSCTNDGVIIPAKIIAARKIKESSEICTVTLDNGESFRCTPNHKIMLRDGSYIEASQLKTGDSLMPCYISERDMKGDGIFRRYVKSKIDSIKYPQYTKPGEKTVIYPIHRIMATHPDSLKTDDGLKLFSNKDSYIVHHEDRDKFNDSPKNLLICSAQEHNTLHASEKSRRLHELAKEDKELFDRVYIRSKQTDEFRQKTSDRFIEYYKSEEGERMKKHLSEKALEEWNNEDLREWRSNETKKYAAEHPDWVKENTKKAKKVQCINILKIIENYLGHLPINSVEYELAIWKLFLEKKIKRVIHFETQLKYYPEIIDLVPECKDGSDEIGYVLSKLVLDSLVNDGLEITEFTFNSKLNLWFNTKKVEHGRGYKSSKKSYPNLFTKYEQQQNNNHKVVSVVVEYLPTSEDVYCLEVDTTEHNFPLGCGVFVKNCEGLSAASGLKAGRHSTTYHAVLPLRGKILNVKDSTVDEALANKEVFTLLNAIGLGIDINNITTGANSSEEAYELIKKYSRYGKIIISTDSDSDGSHIALLILYLISKFARFLIDFGLVYILMSPLYEQDGKFFFANDPFQPGTNLPVGLDVKKHWRRWKGLGSIPRDMVYDVFYNPVTRRLVQVTPDGIDYLTSLVENIETRRDLLTQVGILGDPYGLNNV